MTGTAREPLVFVQRVEETAVEKQCDHRDCRGVTHKVRQLNTVMVVLAIENDSHWVSLKRASKTALMGHLGTEHFKFRYGGDFGLLQVLYTVGKNPFSNTADPHAIRDGVKAAVKKAIAELYTEGGPR